jgi:phosphoserine/homoserine phosphotransferase
MIVAVDLEGVLAPEIWPLLGTQYGIPELLLTTRDLGDFEELMHRRVAALDRAGLRLADLQRIAHAVQPFLGAGEFLDRARAFAQVLIISDTFHEFSDPLVRKLGGYNLFANRFEVDGSGRIVGFKLRIRGKKEKIVDGMRAAGFEVAAMGDSLNDATLLAHADYRILYRPVPALREQFPQARVANDLDAALAYLQEISRTDRNGNGP